jgi:hypothetical protein
MRGRRTNWAAGRRTGRDAKPGKSHLHGRITGQFATKMVKKSCATVGLGRVAKLTLPPLQKQLVQQRDLLKLSADSRATNQPKRSSLLACSFLSSCLSPCHRSLSSSGPTFAPQKHSRIRQAQSFESPSQTCCRISRSLRTAAMRRPDWASCSAQGRALGPSLRASPSRSSTAAHYFTEAAPPALLSIRRRRSIAA